MRPIWKGSITFSLVNIPIALYRATQREELKFHLLRKSDLSPINYKRIAEADGKEVAWTDIVKGYEYEAGKFVVLKEEDFRRADVEATQSIEIQQFVALKEIDPMFFDRPYYLEPQKNGARAYVLLREALRQSGKVGVAKVVIKMRQHLAVVKPEQNALVLELLHFAEELLEPSSLQIPGRVALAPRESKLAVELVERMSGHWEPAQYTEEYRGALLELIHEKVKQGGRTPAAGREPKRAAASKVVDLLAVLQESLGQARPRVASKRRGAGARKAAPLHRKAA